MPGGFMGEFSLSHILLFAIILLLFFGPSRLPQLGQSIGKAIKGFKQGLTEIEAEARPVAEEKKIETEKDKTKV
jgi:sec-independent protein translocase protein TatA